MTEAKLQELRAVASFDPRTLFEADGKTLRFAEELRALPGVERVDVLADGGMAVKLRGKEDALFELVKCLGLKPAG